MELVSSGPGVMEIVNTAGKAPEQFLAVTETVIVAVMVILPLLLATKEGIAPTPEVPNPILISLVHEKAASGDVLLKEILFTVSPEQKFLLVIGLATGVGFTVTKRSVSLLHSFFFANVGVNVNKYLTVIG